MRDERCFGLGLGRCRSTVSFQASSGSRLRQPCLVPCLSARKGWSAVGYRHRMPYVSASGRVPGHVPFPRTLCRLSHRRLFVRQGHLARGAVS